MYQKRNKELEIINLYLRDYNKQFYLREISKLTKLPLKTTQNTIAILEKGNIIKSKIQGKNKYFKLNLENIETKFYLLQSEIYKTSLFINKYKVFKIFLKEINTDGLIIVFGGFAKFTADKNSDLDLLTISQDELPTHLLPYKIHGIRLDKRDFIKSLKGQERLIKEIEENHIILNNHSFYINIMWSHYAK